MANYHRTLTAVSHDTQPQKINISTTSSGRRFIEEYQKAQELNAVSVYLELRGEFDQLQDIDDGQRSIDEWGIFKNWADRRRKCYDKSFGDFTGEGGHEHEVSLVEGAYLKRTKWENAGLIYDTETEQILPATVSEYLFRLAWQDVFFGIMTLILGIVEERQYRYAILTWQKEVVGRIPTEEEI
ncbi:MAG: hypothetical protein RR250_07380, partial [Akkermansia sp.]